MSDVQYIYVLNSAGQFIHITRDFILGGIIAGTSWPSMPDFQLELGPSVGAGAPVGPVVLPNRPVCGGDRGVS